VEAIGMLRERRRSAPSPLTGLASMTWRAMFGSGLWIATTAVTTERRRMVQRGSKVIAPAMLYAAVPGIAMRASSALRTAAG
jgi:hypothetical protein